MGKVNNKVKADGISDPYSGSIDEFLIEKEGKSTQDSAVDSLEEETGKDHVENDGVDPQENLEDKKDDVIEERAEDNVEQLEDQKEELDEKIEDIEKQNAVESQLAKVGNEIAKRGFVGLASIFLKVAKGASARMTQMDIDRILANLEGAEQKFEDHVARIKKSDSAEDKSALVWSENVLGDIRSLISLIADKK